MRCIQCEVEKKRLVLVSFHETQPLPEPDIRTVSLEFLKPALHVPHTRTLIGIVKIIVAPIVRGLPDSTAAMPEDILKSTVLRSMRRIVTQMPLADHSRGIARTRKEVSDRLFIRVHHRTSRAGAVGARGAGVIAGHERCPCRRAERAHVKVRKPHGIPVHPVEVRCLQDRVSMAAQVPITLVIGHYHDDVGTRRGEQRRTQHHRDKNY